MGSVQRDELGAAQLLAEENHEAVEFCKIDQLTKNDLWEIAADAGHIIILSSEYAAGGDPDADNLSLLLRLRHLRKTYELGFSITVEFLDDSCRMMAEDDDDTDFIVASSMAALVLSQMALNPNATAFIKEFIESERNMLTIKSCEAFGCTGKQRSVRELRKIIYLQNHILLGFVLNRGGKAETIINPSLDDAVELTDKDSFIVIGSMNWILRNLRGKVFRQ